MKKRDIITAALEVAGATCVTVAIAELTRGAFGLLFAGAVLIFAGWSAA